MTSRCVSVVTLCRAVKEGREQLSQEDKEHLSKCEPCREKLVDLLLRFAAYADNWVWDDTHLEPVPESIKQTMRDSARKWFINEHSL